MHIRQQWMVKTFSTAWYMRVQLFYCRSICSFNMQFIFPIFTISETEFIQWQQHVSQWSISGETGYMIVWFSHCHPHESALWELKRKNCETPRHQIGPARHLAAKSNNYTDLTPYFYSTVSRLLIADIVCAFNESWWCVFHCDCTSDIFV